jgi:hypothetical protein
MATFGLGVLDADPEQFLAAPPPRTNRTARKARATFLRGQHPQVARFCNAALFPLLCS